MVKVKNPKVVIFSLIALIFIILTFIIDWEFSWLFLVGAIILFFLNQKELMRKKPEKKLEKLKKINSKRKQEQKSVKKKK